MTGVARSLSALWGCWRLAQLDRAGLSGFDPGWSGFRHSYWALILGAPLYLLVIWLLDEIYVDAVIEAKEYAVRLAGFMLAWLGFIALSFPLCRLIGKGERAFAFIAVTNWVRLVILAFNLPVMALAAWGGIDLTTYALVAWMYLLLSCLYKGYAVHAVLDTGWWLSAGIVLLGLVFSRLVQEIVYRSLL